MSDENLNKPFGGFGQVVPPLDADKNITYVAIILDESGSMSRGATQTINNFNEQLQAIQDNNTELNQTFVSLFKFNTFVETVMVNESAASVPEMTTDGFRPRGMTALYDAVGLAIDTILKSQKIEEDNTSVLFVILSDGAENASKNFNNVEIAEKIQACQDTNRWTFTYMGANVDLSEISEKLNIPRGNITSFDASNVKGFADGATVMAGATAMYMTTRSKGSTGIMNCSSVDTFYSNDTSVEDMVLNEDTSNGESNVSK